MRDLDFYEKAVSLAIAITGALYACYIKIMLPILSIIGARTKADKAKFDEMYHVLIGANGHSISSRLERIEARQILHEQTNKFLMTSLDVCFWYCDMEGRAVEISTPLAKMLMRSEKELTGMNWIKFVHDEDRERIIDAWQFAQENGSDFDEVYRFNLPTGDILRVRGVVYQMIDKHNEPKGYFGTLMRLEK